jgi:hypothetical protein
MRISRDYGILFAQTLVVGMGSKTIGITRNGTPPVVGLVGSLFRHRAMKLQ